MISNVEITHQPHIHRAVLTYAGGGEAFLTLLPIPGETVTALLDRLDAESLDLGGVPLRLLAFGDRLGGGVSEAVRRGWPTTWVEGADCAGAPVAGLQAHVLMGQDPVRAQGGAAWQVGGSRLSLLVGVMPTSDGDRGGQATEAFAAMAAGLGALGADPRSLVRTWIHLDRITDWYDAFNASRAAYFADPVTRPNSLPASTGIGMANPAGMAIAMDALAVEGSATVEALGSPLQCPAPEYGSRFSRALELGFEDHRRLYVSGTASIAPGGATQHVDNPARQVGRTLDVVGAILESRGMAWRDVTRATAYFTRAADSALLAPAMAEAGIRSLPVVIAQGEVCRRDLLFELEVDAIGFDAC